VAVSEHDGAVIHSEGCRAQRSTGGLVGGIAVPACGEPGGNLNNPQDNRYPAKKPTENFQNARLYGCHLTKPYGFNIDVSENSGPLGGMQMWELPI
jgi:hypothetical protein